MTFGNQPIDGGNLILSTAEKEDLLSQYPEATNFIRRYYGSQEFNKGIVRWCIWLRGQNLAAAKSIPIINDRIESVRKFREQSDRVETNEQAKTPHLFVYTPHVDTDAIIVPSVSSEKRNFITAGFLSSDAVISQGYLLKIEKLLQIIRISESLS